MAAEGVESPVGKIAEVVPNSGWFKIHTDYSDHTVYELQNRSSVLAVATMRFFDCENILFEPDPLVEAQPSEGGIVLRMGVRPGTTAKLVTMRTQAAG